MRLNAGGTGYGSNLDAQVNTVQFVYIEQFINDMQAYFNEITEMQQLVASTATLASDMMSTIYRVQTAKDSDFLKFQVLINRPTVIIPRYWFNANASNIFITVTSILRLSLWLTLVKSTQLTRYKLIM